MIKKNLTYRLFLLMVCCAMSFLSIAQSVEITTDRNQILIGERIEYKLLVRNVPQGNFTIKLLLPDSVAHFEVVEPGVFDTTSNNGVTTLSRKISFTSFDSGSWYFPPLLVAVTANNLTNRLKTDSVLVNVGYAPSDSTNELRDIRPIMDVQVKSYFWYYVVAAILSLLLIVFLVSGYLKRKKQLPVPVMHSAQSPFHQAMQELKSLSQLDLTVTTNIKQYHTSLGFILKRYMSRVNDHNLMNKTTGDMLLQLKDTAMEPAMLSAVAEALRMADAVKFAKYIPSSTNSGLSHTAIKNAIEMLEGNKVNKNQKL